MRIPDEDARELGRIIHAAAVAKGLSDGQIADAATRLLPDEAPPELVISAYYVQSLRGAPRQPLGRPEGRLKFAAVVEALGLDRQLANRLAGGI